MTDFGRPAPASRQRWTWVAILVLVAFAAGLLLASVGLRRLGSTTAAQRATPAPAARPAPAPSPAINSVATPLAAAIDPATLATREAALAGQLAALEARTATVDADSAAAAGQAGRAEALLIAFAARRAIDRGLSLGYLDGELRLRFGASQPRALAIILQSARQPLTLEDLRQGLDGIAADIATGAGTDGWLTSLRRELAGLIVLRKAGTPSPLPAARLASARRLLDAGQVEAAREEVSRLPGASDAANWMQAAQRYVLVRHALDRLEAAAITGQTAPVKTPTL